MIWETPEKYAFLILQLKQLSERMLMKLLEKSQFTEGERTWDVNDMCLLLVVIPFASGQPYIEFMSLGFVN